MLRLAALFIVLSAGLARAQSFPVVDTNQTACWDDRRQISCPGAGERFHGQDGHHPGRRPGYRDNGDGTVTDLVTGLIWQKEFRRVTWVDAPADAAASRVGGFSDWRVPTIKELYSLMDFSGSTGRAMPQQVGAPADARPYLDARVFAFEYPSQGRYIDAQYVSSTAYLGTTMGRDRAFFGVNFADGRIKAYPQDGGMGRRLWYARYVRGPAEYGRNHLAANGDGTVSDRATGLTWMQADSGRGMDWEHALAYCQALTLAGRDDWRLPDAKELHSIVDYTRAPDVTGTPALDPIFAATPIVERDGSRNWPYYWSSTTHLDGRMPGDFAVYVAFGKAMGNVSANGPMGMGGLPGMGGPGMGMGGPPGMGGPGMGGPGMGGPGMGMGGPPGMGGPGMGGGTQDVSSLRLVDVHGAGAQRSSPKSGDESRLPVGAGPQGDVLRINNFVRCVRG